MGALVAVGVLVGDNQCPAGEGITTLGVDYLLECDFSDNQCPAGEGITTRDLNWPLRLVIRVTTNAPQERGLRLTTASLNAAIAPASDNQCPAGEGITTRRGRVVGRGRRG